MSAIFYLKATLTAESPLIIGSGTDDNTDSDILIDADDKPFIPGTTLAGVFRHYYQNQFGEDATKKIFGYIVPNRSEEQTSAIVTYDAPVTDATPKITTRDGVKINQDKVADLESRGKFDYEVIAEGAKFAFKAELTADSESEARKVFSVILGGFASGDLRIGGKSTRGFGQIRVSDIVYRTLMLPRDIREYIDFKWDSLKDTFEADSNVNAKPLYTSKMVDFEIPSFIFIRTYVTTAVDENNDNKAIDAQQLYNAGGKPIIPGTTWAGVFRHHCVRILAKVGYPEIDAVIDDMFGYVKEGKDNKAAVSKIIFPKV
ncbi:hypothetical protein FACS1894105_00510 [Clostridia bacterium]|nr:hypothetical protein FACS1894105_00510 [Clostridia bacterium]